MEHILVCELAALDVLDVLLGDDYLLFNLTHTFMVR